MTTLTPAITKNSQLGNAIQAIKNAKKAISDNMLPSLKYSFCPYRGLVFHFSIDTKKDDWLNSLSLAECIAEEMKEFDHPIHPEQAKKFCAFMGMTEKDTQTILSSCCTEEQWQEFVSY